MATWLFLIRMRPGCHVLGHWYNSSELFQMLPRCFKLQNISLFPPPFYQIENFRQRWRQRPGGCRPTCWSKRDTHSTSTSTWPATSTCPTCPARPRNLILKPGTGTCWTQCLRLANLVVGFQQIILILSFSSRIRKVLLLSDSSTTQQKFKRIIIH